MTMKNNKSNLFFIFIWFQNLTMRSKIISVSVIMILLPMCFSAFYFFISLSSVLTNNEYENLNQQINKTVENIELSFNILNNTSFHFLSSNNIREWLSTDQSLIEDKLSLLQKKLEIESDLKYSMLFNNAWDMGLIATAYLFINEETYSMLLRAPYNIDIINQNNINIYKDMSTNHSLGKLIIPPSPQDRTIYFARTVSKPGNPQDSLRLILGTNENTIFQKFEDLTTYPGSMAYIINQTGRIYSCTDKNLLGEFVQEDILRYKDLREVKEVILHEETYFVTSRQIGESGLTFICAIPRKKILSSVSGSFPSYLFITGFILLIFISLSLLISIKSTYFVNDLLVNINKVKIGDYSALMPSYKTKELNEISSTFNNMTDEIKYLINQVYEKKLLLKETDIKFLQSQMNPHFLFNVLVTIGMKSRMLKDESISKMIDALSELLQAGIYSSKNTKITIRQELEYVQLYLYLQKVRFEDTLKYEINIQDPSILDCYIPRFCVEPIVENAVAHGIEKSGKEGDVSINVTKESEFIIFEIIDNGLGFDTEAIDIENNINQNKFHNSIGLKNTNRRIKLIYGEKYGINIASAVGKGCKVTIKIPVDIGGDLNV